MNGECNVNGCNVNGTKYMFNMCDPYTLLLCPHHRSIVKNTLDADKIKYKKTQ